MAKATTEMISALEAKLGKEELRRRIDELRRDDEGYIHTRAMVAIYQIYESEFPDQEEKQQ